MRPDSLGLSFSLMLVFLAFCLMMAGVLVFCLRERRKIDGLDDHRECAGLESTTTEMMTEQFITNPQNIADDNRVAMVLFGSIIGGAMLALITGYLVFFRDW